MKTPQIIFFPPIPYNPGGWYVFLSFSTENHPLAGFYLNGKDWQQHSPTFHKTQEDAEIALSVANPAPSKIVCTYPGCKCQNTSKYSP